MMHTMATIIIDSLPPLAISPLMKGWRVTAKNSNLSFHHLTMGKGARRADRGGAEQLPPNNLNPPPVLIARRRINRTMKLLTSPVTSAQIILEKFN